MPQAKQPIRPEGIYHLIPRFVGGEWFIRGPEERTEYLRLFAMGLQSSDWQCLAYALMSSHIHLGLIAGSMELASWMRDVHREFANWINERYGPKRRIGGVFVRGPKRYEVLQNGVAKLIGYIHRNPVRAGIVSDPNESDWTSHRAYVGSVPRPSWLASPRGLELSGFRDSQEMHRWICATNIEKYDLEAAIANAPRRGAPRKVRPPSAGLPSTVLAGYRDDALLGSAVCVGSQCRWLRKARKRLSRNHGCETGRHGHC